LGEGLQGWLAVQRNRSDALQRIAIDSILRLKTKYLTDRGLDELELDAEVLEVRWGVLVTAQFDSDTLEKA
jgi:hypothetical protein